MTAPVFAWRDAVARGARGDGAEPSRHGAGLARARRRRWRRQRLAGSQAAQARARGRLPARRRRAQPRRAGAAAGERLDRGAAPRRAAGDGRGRRRASSSATPTSSSATPTAPARCPATMSRSGADAAARAWSTPAAGPTTRSSSAPRPARAPTGRDAACSSRTTARPLLQRLLARPRARQPRAGAWPSALRQARREAGRAGSARPCRAPASSTAVGVALVLDQRVGARVRDRSSVANAGSARCRRL